MSEFRYVLKRYLGYCLSLDGSKAYVLNDAGDEFSDMENMHALIHTGEDVARYNRKTSTFIHCMHIDRDRFEWDAHFTKEEGWVLIELCDIKCAPSGLVECNIRSIRHNMKFILSSLLDGKV